jgi:hypothetical protein
MAPPGRDARGGLALTPGRPPARTPPPSRREAMSTVALLAVSGERLAADLATWAARDDTRPQPEVRRAGSDAIDAIDTMLGELYALRSRLVGEIRVSDELTDARAGVLLARSREARGGPSGLCPVTASPPPPPPPTTQTRPARLPGLAPRRRCAVGVRLMAEVLDHYHGTDMRKVWLLAFAENASDQTRQGWPGRQLMTHRTGKSASRVSHIASELVGEGAIKRVGGGGRHRGEVRYELLPLAANDSQDAAGAHSETASQDAASAHSETASQDAARAHSKTGLRVRNRGSQGAVSGSQGAAISPLPAETSHNPQNPQEPSSARARAPAHARGPAGIIRAAYPDATDDEIEIITEDRASHGARNLAAVLAHEVRLGTLRLPCDRDGIDRHSEACRDGASSRCAYADGWCDCRCHTEPEAEP